MAKMKAIKKYIQYWQGYGTTRIFIHFWWKLGYFHSHFGRQIAWQYNQKLNICIYSIPFLSLCPTEAFIFLPKDLYINVQ